MQNYTPGTIVENSTGPMLVQSVQRCGDPEGTGPILATLVNLPGPRTARQQEREDYNQRDRDRRDADLIAFEALTEAERAVFNAILGADFIENGVLLAEVRKVAKEIVQICQS